MFQFHISSSLDGNGNGDGHVTSDGGHQYNINSSIGIDVLPSIPVSADVLFLLQIIIMADVQIPFCFR